MRILNDFKRPASFRVKVIIYSINRYRSEESTESGYYVNVKITFMILKF